MQDKKEQLELDKEQWTSSKLGKEHINAVYCHSADLTYMQSTSFHMYIMRNAWLDESQAGINTARRNTNNLR